VFRPLLYSIAVVALIVVGAQHFHLVHRYQAILLWVIAGPCALVTLTRVWRWRSHKVRVTNQRVVVEGGVIRHRRSVIDLHDVVATHIDQRVSERLVRRGRLWLETTGGSFLVGTVRHPGALLRIIDAERVVDPTTPPYRDDDYFGDMVEDNGYRRTRRSRPNGD
jgi:membrane protein YdbS with pleckstrin-like domain